MNSNTLETTSEEMMGEKNIRKQKQLPSSKSRKKRLLLLSIGLGLLIALGFGLYRLFFTQEERVAMTGTTTYGFLNEAIEGSGTTTPADSVTYEVSGTVPSGGDKTSNVEEDQQGMMMPGGFEMGQMPNFNGQMPEFNGQMPGFSGSGGQRPSFSGGMSGMSGGMPGGRG